MDDEPTQPSTQQVIDPRRLGRTESGLDESDIADIMCILTPTSRAAIKIVENTARDNPQHILQNQPAMEYLPNSQPLTQPCSQNLEEAETFVLQRSDTAHDIALRFSSSPKQLQHQFCFGRNQTMCDIILPTGPDSIKRISNLHFRIYITKDGIMMLEDMSTNGTLVDETLLKAKSRDRRSPKTMMLHPGAMITLLSPIPDEIIKFIVRVPDRTGYEEEFGENLHDWLLRVEDEKERKHVAEGFVVPTTPNAKTAVRRPVVNSVKTFGMHWNGGREYNVVDLLGKGAFATVYKLATTMDGEVLAAKELEKKRFMKNGQMDQKLDNEMKIMQDLTHPHIVQYIDTRDMHNYLYIIMEYVPYGNLSELLTRNELLPELAVMRMACQIFSALAYLHSKRITHRDIKPDNILIASEEPFDVKLSDFGLSKVVSNNDTFLKTFCGTLLYCAPEVFPHYSRNGNRKRRKPGEAKKNFHSYSQSVDIWSFGAVLWLALCGTPPFEGIMDNTGRAMFDRIMETPLDPAPLRAHGVSELAIDLLVAMLNVDPSLRPTEIQCLQHPWLSGLAREIIPDIAQPDLRAIPEEDEEDENLEAEAEDKFSQLSLNDRKEGYRHPECSSDDDQDDYGENDPDAINPHQSKRIRRDPFNPRYQHRDQSQFESSPEEFQKPAARACNVIGSFARPRVNTRGPRRLFGEVEGHRALDNKTNQVLIKEDDSSGPDILDKSPKANQSIKRRSKTPIESQASPRKDPRGNKSAASLYGAEAMVSKLTVNPSPSPSSPDDHTSEPRTPSAPDHSIPETPSPVNAAENGTTNSTSDEPTPKAPNISFSRQINLPKTPSYFFDPWDKSTHTAEYAAKAALGSGGGVTVPNSTSMPSTHFPSEDSEEGADDEDNNEGLAGGAVQSPRATDSGFLVPAPRLGKLTTTDDSCQKLVLRLEKQVESWGRHSDNTIVYSDSSDRRVPKNAFTLWFFSPGNDGMHKDSSRDWTKAQDLEVQIHTNCRWGIHVNDIRLDPPYPDGRYPYGILYTGDVITVYDNGRGKSLKFVCEFAVGESAKRRPEGLDFHVMQSSPLR